MEEIKEIDLISQSEKYLIDFSNLSSGLIANQDSFLGKEMLQHFCNNKILGIPLLLPKGLNTFDYSSVSEEFEINENEIALKVFKTKNLNYVGVRNFFQYGNIFCKDATPKPENKKILKTISNINNNLKKKIDYFVKNKKSVIAFQTRNIPHLGHEKIIKMLLKSYDYLFVNPVIGPKKKGDIKTEVLSMVFEYLSKNFYENRIIFAPMCANMFYAGPREAVHHALLRKNVGFSSFVVGRDHAGAENNFGPEDAINTVRLVENDIGIDIITHMGSYFNNSTNKIVIKDHSNMSDDLLNISGTEFRKCIKDRTFFKFARREMQDFLLSYSGNLFY